MTTRKKSTASVSLHDIEGLIHDVKCTAVIAADMAEMADSDEKYAEPARYAIYANQAKAEELFRVFTALQDKQAAEVAS